MKIYIKEDNVKGLTFYLLILVFGMLLVLTALFPIFIILTIIFYFSYAKIIIEK